MTILVTGAAGYIGNNIVKRLVNGGRPVRAMVHNLEKGKRRLSDLEGDFEVVYGDVTRPETLTATMQGVSTVIHLVAIAMEGRNRTYESINYQGTVNVVNAAVQAGVTRFINMSQNGASSAVPYRFLKSKGLAQEYVVESAPNWTALRPSAVFGPQDEFFNSIARLVKLTPLIFPLIGGGKAEFQPVSVHDLAEVAVRCLDDDTTIGRELVLGGPEILTLGEIEKRILSAMGAKRLLVPAPAILLRAPVFLMEHLLPGSPVSSSLLDLLAVPNTTPQNDLVDYFGIDPIPFEGEHITYLKDNSVSATLKKLFTGATVN
jgi:uncharacterized protein YbjT (DUF2867 family)